MAAAASACPPAHLPACPPAPWRRFVPEAYWYGLLWGVENTVLSLVPVVLVGEPSTEVRRRMDPKVPEAMFDDPSVTCSKGGEHARLLVLAALGAPSSPGGDFAKAGWMVVRGSLHEDCSTSRCCQDLGFQCFQESAGYAASLKTRNRNASWSCKALSNETRFASVTEYSQLFGCCADSGHQCTRRTSTGDPA